jgi:ATP-dependent RNA helicase RhlE
MNIRRAVVLGGVSKGPQINALKRGVHVLVATPGRLLDHVNMRSCDLSGVQTLVIDEADRMFDMGFIRDIKKIVAMIPMKRRTALFSATMPAEIKKFAYDILQDPYRVDLSTRTMVVDRIDQKVMIVRTPEKQSRLHTILADPAAQRVIVFTRTKRGADRVAERLAMAGISASAFHGNKAQNARQRALNDFTMGHVRVLVATDIAARGIDVSNITHVINFEMPVDPETYVHRVGRTARKGNSGIAISLCDPGERQEIQAIERLMKQKIDVIGDVGGETLPLPARRPHHAENAPRRDGGHRGGRGGENAHGRGGAHSRPERGRDRTESDRSRGVAAAPADLRNHGTTPVSRGPEGDALFGVGVRPERQRHDAPHRGERRPTDQRGGRHQSSEHRPGGHRSGEHRSGERRGEHRPARDGDAHRTDRPQADRHADAAPKREGGHAPRQQRNERGDSRPTWTGTEMPKFMRRGENDRGRARPGRNPAN